MKAHILNRLWLRADVDDLDFTEYREVADESIDSGSDINVPLGFCGMDPTRDISILIKVRTQRAATFVSLGEHG